MQRSETGLVPLCLDASPQLRVSVHSWSPRTPNTSELSFSRLYCFGISPEEYQNVCLVYLVYAAFSEAAIPRRIMHLSPVMQRSCPRAPFMRQPGLDPLHGTVSTVSNKLSSDLRWLASRCARPSLWLFWALDCLLKRAGPFLIALAILLILLVSLVYLLFIWPQVRTT